MKHLESVINEAFDKIDQMQAANVPPEVSTAIDEVLAKLNDGSLRVAEKTGSDWHTHAWIKKAVLLYFRLSKNEKIDGHFTNFYDKVPLKYAHSTTADLDKNQTRIVPAAIARYGSYQAAGVILMPSYVNIGAYVDSGTMVDTWATVGSCAQIGKNVHLSGGVGIGGVLEPLQANPTIIEDNCFIGARSEIVEGVIVRENAVISMGVYIGMSTKIYNRETGTVTYGEVPAGAVVVPGNLPSKDGKYSLYCAVVVKQVDEKTRSKVAINQILRSSD